MIRRLLFFILFVWLFAACKDNDDPNAIDKITRSLNRTNEVISEYNEKVYNTLYRKLGSSRTQAKAQVWYPKSLRLKKMSAGFYAYIDSLQKQVLAPGTNAKKVSRLLNKESERLHRELVSYYDIASILDTTEFSDNTFYIAALKRDMIAIGKFIASRLKMGNDSAMTSYKDARLWVRHYFDNATPAQAYMVLCKFKHDVLTIESCLVEYFNFQVISNFCGFTDSYSVIAAISTKHVKAGQAIEIYAGKGIYSSEMIPEVTIYDSILPIGPEGTGTYSFIAKGEPGKHTIPVQIAYYKPDGSKATVTKNIEYIIAE